MIRARPKASLVVMGTWNPVMERALMPESLSSMEKSATETCSPVAMRASTSAGSGSVDHSSARVSRRLVSPERAESTTTGL